MQSRSSTKPPTLARLRLYSQHLAGARFETPGEVVGRLGAVQAQDYLGALWALGLRLRKAIEREVEAALADRSIVRTWPMRGTLHFVAAADVRWMLELLAGRVIAGNAARLQRQYSLDESAFARSRDVFIQVLQGGKQLTRNELYKALDAAHIPTAGGRGLHILWWVAQQGLVCFGPRQGKQQTIVLLNEWVPDARRLDRDEALSELARRYFISHGPATLQDFMWWSGLTTREAQAGLEGAKSLLVQEVIDGQAYWLSAAMPATEGVIPAALLLPAFDEYTVAYKDRRSLAPPSITERPDSSFLLLNPVIVINGLVAGNWKRTLKKNELVIHLLPFAPLAQAEQEAVGEAARRYGEFLGLPVVLA